MIMLLRFGANTAAKEWRGRGRRSAGRLVQCIEFSDAEKRGKAVEGRTLRKPSSTRNAWEVSDAMGTVAITWRVNNLD
jgi:hypothetical protein